VRELEFGIEEIDELSEQRVLESGEWPKTVASHRESTRKVASSLGFAAGFKTAAMPPN